MIDLSAVDVSKLLKYLDIPDGHLNSSGTEVHFPCFGPEHSDGGSAYINVHTTAWFCHGCKRRGNAITLVEEVREVTRSTAERNLRDWFGIEFDEPIGGSMVSETESRFRAPAPPPLVIPPPRSWLSGVRVDWYEAQANPEPFHRYMFDRGFTPATLTEWDIGYDYLSDRLTIPIFDLDGELFGIKARDWTGAREPKYLILGDREYPRYGFLPYEATDVVFGLHRARDHKTVVLCEGELNAKALAQLGVPRPIATGMSYFSPRHAQLIVREADEVIVYYDAGQAGYEGVWGYENARGLHVPGVVGALELQVKVRVVMNPLPEDPSKLVELGRGDLALQAIEEATSSLASQLVFR